MKDKIKMIVFVLVLGSILTTSLVAVDALTTPYIEANQRKKLQSGILEAAGIKFTDANIEEVFSKQVQPRDFPQSVQQPGRKYYVTSGGDVIFEYRGSGFQDEIYGTIALKADMETIKGISIVSQKETPGLGGRIGEPAFLGQFGNKKVVPELRIAGEGKASGDNEVNGMSGATMSCNAFQDLLNSELKKYIPAIKEAIKK